eukprot:CAMPEP_0174380832 /NCGR_PEP_ID=MMETSP0811_2-20130205/123620_1 /TAXON_ID=73025 ORGANISM="Eutreptiella gymnastica-like, Strain CCMP1594" /NCGR_SAMPLE_ID=MMETSP0811_2 /ASSEMBLY_ACC=CAM_ASM_000667 /LENGTH=125 /DNA_ID=CAMNT_0015533795 /DNA_START=958 /DNA_END=1335 /DNA_ORIENTATION=+
MTKYVNICEWLRVPYLCLGVDVCRLMLLPLLSLVGLAAQELWDGERAVREEGGKGSQVVRGSAGWDVWIRLSTSVGLVRRDQQELDPTDSDMQMRTHDSVQLVPTEFQVRPERILPSGTWYGGGS